MVNKQTKQLVKMRDKNKCVKCGATDNLTIDHIIPISRGGLNTPDNLQTMCAQCNRRKRSTIDWNWLEKIQMALHIDAIIERLKMELRGAHTSFVGIVNQKLVQTISDAKNEINQREVKMRADFRASFTAQEQEIAALREKLAAIESYMCIEFVEETTTFRGYKKKKK